MQLFMKALEREVDELHANGVRIDFVGDLSAFSPELAQRMQAAMTRTLGNIALRLNVAVNYGGRWDIVQATRAIATAVAREELDPSTIDEAAFARHLCLADQPPVDLFIRTGGEMRISNFLLWQVAYAELYFTEALWPDVNADILGAALAEFARRERRYGLTSAQVRAAN